MCKKLIYLVSFILVLGLVGTSTAESNDPNLVGWWTFDEGSGTVAKDASGKSVDGTFFGEPTWGKDGRHRGILLFDGSDDYVFIDGLFALPVYTITLWFRVDDGSGQRDIFSAYALGVQHGILLELQTGGTLRYLHRYPLGLDPTQGTNIYTTTTHDDGAWYHVAMVKSEDAITLYVNGEQVNSTADNSVFDPTDAFGVALGILDNERGLDRLFPGAMDDIRIYNRVLSQDEIQTITKGEIWPYAWGPEPDDGTMHIGKWVNISWSPGDFAVSHDVYFGTDFNDVNEATKDNPRDVLVSQDKDDLTYDFPVDLEFNQTYYWRVDEVNDIEPNSPWRGDIWSFTTANYIVVEDFEDYNDFPPNEIFMTWVDGWDVPTNGATSGYPAPDFVGGVHYMEDDIVHSGDWSMPLFYDNSVGLSEATRTFDSSLKDWTRDDVITLTLFYYGDAGNAIEPMYVALNGNAVITNDDARAALDNEWNQWDILLQDFADQSVDLTNVHSMSIGFGNKANPTPGGKGHVFFDDIRLYRSPPVVQELEPEPVDPSTSNLVAYYAFENNTQDSSGKGNNATAFQDPPYVSGPTGFGSAIELNGFYHYVDLPIGSVINTLTDCTIATWVNWSDYGGDWWQRIFDFGTGETVYMFLSSNAGGSVLRFAITIEGNAAGAEDQTDGTGILPSGWHHVAVTIDSDNTTHTLYLDGRIVGQNAAARYTPSDLGEITQNWLGKSQYVADPYFGGSLDEFRIYDRVLSDAELLYLMGR